ncbi:MAG: hypothetical protein COV45_07875 [Deltaproteobacteria bacterium CG11_big_fil_rev_8_21_14_0_20_47_16]|nr:MAG: hypothetical protein COV45_07875 [Deltaproteobacteria bacterium CG11_big_fil_rev_8_21_14_0_20_47_16]
MSDGVKRKIAIVINGDTAARHAKNVDRAVSQLNKKGYQCFVASNEAPSSPTSMYRKATPQNIDQLIEAAKAQLDGDDELLIYTTGHGGKVDGQECIVVGDLKANHSCEADLYKKLDNLKFGKRVVVMDQCYSGGMARLFTDNAKSAFISAGSSDETVCCGDFAPRLWADDSEVKDINKDGVISWGERFEYAKKGVIQANLKSIPQFITTKGFEDDGVHFAPYVIEVDNSASMNEQLSRLRPGQTAVVTFSMDRCLPCRELKPKFNGLAESDVGQNLWLRTENTSVGNEYGIQSFPKVVIFTMKENGVKEMNVVTNRDKIRETLQAVQLGSYDNVNEIANNEDPINRAIAYARLAFMLEKSGQPNKAIPLYIKAISATAETQLRGLLRRQQRLPGAYQKVGRLLALSGLEDSVKTQLFSQLIQKVDDLYDNAQDSYIQSLAESLVVSRQRGTSEYTAVYLFKDLIAAAAKINKPDSCGLASLDNIALYVKAAQLGAAQEPLFNQLIGEAVKQKDHVALRGIADAVSQSDLGERKTAVLMKIYKESQKIIGNQNSEYIRRLIEKNPT